MPTLCIPSSILHHPKLKTLSDEFGCESIAALFGLWLWCGDSGKTSIKRSDILSCKWESSPTGNVSLKPKDGLSREDVENLYIEKLVSLGIIDSISHDSFLIKNPFKPKVPLPGDAEVNEVLEGYYKHHPDRKRIVTPYDCKMIADRLSEGFSVNDLIKAAEGIKKCSYYAENNFYSIKAVYGKPDKTEEHIGRVANKSKPKSETSTIGHHSGSKEFSNGRAEL